MTLGEKIRSLRKAAGLSQEALAEQLGVSRQAVSKWENDNGMPETEKLITMAKLFGTSLDALIGEEKNGEIPPPEPQPSVITPTTDAGHSTDLSLVESYLDNQQRRTQRIGLAVLILIASLGLVYFFSTLVMLLWMALDIVAIAMLILAFTTDDPFKRWRQQAPQLDADTLYTLQTRYAAERPSLRRQLFISILCMLAGLLLAPLLLPAGTPLADDLALASGMVLTGFGAALCIFSSGRIRAYHRILANHLPITKE